MSRRSSELSLEALRANGGPRRLPLRVEPGPDEAFASYVDRAAAALRVSVAELLRALGLFRAPEVRISVPRLYGVELARPDVEAVSVATGIGPSGIERMLLSRFDGIALDLRTLRRGLPQATTGWAYFTGSHVCPRCIAERPIWRVQWKLPWLFACSRHEVLLVDTCSGCGHRCGHGRPDGRTAPAFLSRCPEPGRCANPAAAAERGRRAVPCGQQLDQLATESMAGFGPLVQMQRRVEAMLAAGATGEGIQPYFRELRSVCSLVLFAAEVDDLPALPQLARDAFASFTGEARDRAATRAALRAAGADARRGPRTRYFGAVPTSAALMAAVMAAAVPLVEIAEPDELAGALEWLARRAAARAPGWTLELPRYLDFTPRLRHAFAETVSRTSLAASLSPRARRRSGRREHSYVPEHVPQLLWADVYEDELSRLLHGTRPESGRLFASMALVKMCGAYTWRQAAAVLGHDDRRAEQLACAIVARTNRSGLSAEVHAALETVAGSLSSSAQKIDYAVRRRTLAGLRAIPRDDWLSICATSNVLPGRGGREVLAATWLWADLTCGDYRRAPSHRPIDGASARDMYRRFCKSHLPALQTHLRAYGDLLLGAAEVVVAAPEVHGEARGRKHSVNHRAGSERLVAGRGGVSLAGTAGGLLAPGGGA